MRLSFNTFGFVQSRGSLAAMFLCLFVVGRAQAQGARVSPEPPRVARLPAVDDLPELPSPRASVDASVRAAPDALLSPPSHSAWNLPVTTPPESMAAPPTETEEEVVGPFGVPEWLRREAIPRANLSGEGERWLSEFSARVEQERDRPPPMQFASLPGEYRPWWDEPVRQPSTPALYVSIDRLIEGALQYSSYVQVVSQQPRIFRTSIIEEQAAFDWRAFLETTYNDVNEPVGNVLTTGTNEDRFKDRTWFADGGVRRNNRLGGNVELSQRLGTQDNNSRFLMPNPQGTSQLELRYTQPLLNGAGYAYNESRIVLAEIGSNISSDDLVEELEGHLIKVTEAYWELYRARAEYVQRPKLLSTAETTLTILEGREGVDAVLRQVLRARAAVATRRSEIIRAYTSIRNAESRLRLLVNDPALVQAGGREFAPVDAPLMDALPVAMEGSLYTALHYRPDISRAIREISASAVRLGVARTDILPKLDLIASTYVAGLAAQTNVGRSFGTQFDEGRPAFSLGLVFEVPFGRRAAHAQEERRQLEMQRAFGQFRLTVEEALTGVEIAVREVETNYREMVSHFHALAAVTDEEEYLFDRWETLPGAEDSAMLLLENLLDAQERVADEEAASVVAQVSYAMSMVRLKQEMGTLLIVTPAAIDPVMVNDLPPGE
ncbi:MAG: TolC family protein [Pirellulaceae bacterium]